MPDVALCGCPPCKDWRGDLYGEGEVVCFETFRKEAEEENKPFGHGPCVDPWGQGCTCIGTAVDGECEACWLWMK